METIYDWVTLGILLVWWFYSCNVPSAMNQMSATTPCFSTWGPVWAAQSSTISE